MISVKNGDKVVPRGPAPVSEVQELARAVNNFAGRVAAAMEKPDDTPISQPAPIVSVAAPNVSISPQVMVERPSKWRFTVTKRDSTAQQRIQEIVAEIIP